MKTILFVDQTKQPAGYIEQPGQCCGAGEHLTLKQAYELGVSDVQVTFKQFKRQIADMRKSGKEVVLIMEPDSKLFLQCVDRIEVTTLPDTERPN